MKTIITILTNLFLINIAFNWVIGLPLFIRVVTPEEIEAAKEQEEIKQNG